jgi:hypothetical protein
MKHEGTGADGAAPFLLIAFLLAFAPLFLGGNRPLPLLVLELAALAGLVALAWWRAARLMPASLPSTLRWGIGLLVVVPLLQLIPLPAGWWSALPGHGPYFRALEAAGDGATQAMRPLSIHARATEYSWLVILPCLAIFLLTLSQTRTRVRTLAMVFVVVAVGEAILGVVQLGAAAGSPLYLGNRFGGGASTGTYVNKNHFAALMAMALPLALVLWFLETMPWHGRLAADPPSRPRFSDRRLAMQIVLAIPVLLLIVALLFSNSRGGIGSGLLAFSLASLVLVWRAASISSRLAFALIGVAALSLAAYIGLTPVLDRFAPGQLSLGYDGRVLIAAASLRGGLDFLPFGSGLGTFADVFRRYQVEGLSGFVDHAHNDYAELFLELGVAGVAVIALFGAAYLARWVELARAWHSRTLEHLQVAAGLGMLAMIVHATIEFNFHIPANAVYFSFLAGVFYFTPAGEAHELKPQSAVPTA